MLIIKYGNIHYFVQYCFINHQLYFMNKALIKATLLLMFITVTNTVISQNKKPNPATQKTVANDQLFSGEIGLSGELRSVSNLEKRIREAEKLGFKKIFVPKMSKPLLSKTAEFIQLVDLQEYMKVQK